MIVKDVREKKTFLPALGQRSALMQQIAVRGMSAELFTMSRQEEATYQEMRDEAAANQKAETHPLLSSSSYIVRGLRTIGYLDAVADTKSGGGRHNPFCMCLPANILLQSTYLFLDLTSYSPFCLASITLALTGILTGLPI